jgi:hypothetical protein
MSDAGCRKTYSAIAGISEITEFANFQFLVMVLAMPYGIRD